MSNLDPYSECEPMAYDHMTQKRLVPLWESATQKIRIAESSYAPPISVA